MFRNSKAPSFWVNDGPDGLHRYKLRTCFEIVPMQWDWQVIVNYYEAKAYCNWLAERNKKNYRLLTEAEHHCLRQPQQHNEFLPENANINLRYASECPVNQYANGIDGLYD